MNLRLLGQPSEDTCSFCNLKGCLLFQSPENRAPGLVWGLSLQYGRRLSQERMKNSYSGLSRPRFQLLPNLALCCTLWCLFVFCFVFFGYNIVQSKLFSGPEQKKRLTQISFISKTSGSRKLKADWKRRQRNTAVFVEQ